jgi:hypothetical protein
VTATMRRHANGLPPRTGTDRPAQTGQYNVFPHPGHQRDERFNVAMPATNPIASASTDTKT